MRFLWRMRTRPRYGRAENFWGRCSRGRSVKPLPFQLSREVGDWIVTSISHHSVTTDRRCRYNMMTTKQTGDISEATVTAALLRAGKSVLIPFGDRSRYDVALDDNGKLVRIQVKTGWVRNGVLTFKTVSSTRQNGKRVETDYRGQIELFAVCSPSGEVYLVPPDQCGRGVGYLRLSAPKLKGNKKSIRYAKDFILGR